MTACPTKLTPRFDTLLLVLVAAATLTVARAHAAWSPTTMAVRAICELTVTVILSLVLLRRAKSLVQVQGFAVIAVTIAVVYPFVAELAMRQFAGGSEPLEMVMLTSLQLSAVALAVFCHVPRLGGAAVLLSGFLLLFATTTTSNRTTLLLSGTYGVLVMWWMMGAYWDRLAGAFVASTVERRIPLRVSVIGGTAIVLLLLAGLIGTRGGLAVALPGLLPTSGGTKWHDPHARSGVGDGDAMVAAEEDAMSFGPVDSELFLDSDKPTLYDIFNDIYGEPPKPKKKHERSIALAPEDLNESETEQQIAKTERSGREFSAVRRKVARKRQTLDDRPAPAMLYVVGRVPLHLALERFDSFDGRDWTHSERRESYPPIRLQQEEGKPWAYVARVGASPIHRGMEPHALKIINLKTNRFPSPPQLATVHIDKMDQLDFFGWTDDGVVCMPVRDHIPQLTVLHFRSHGVNLQTLRETDFTARFPAVASERPDREHSAVDVQAEKTARHLDGAGHCAAVSHVAAAWTRDIPRGWRQVEAVVERLRRDFTLDPQAKAPEDCPDVVAHFLQTRSGPDYLFATSAAIVLRRLGYPTRLVTGFYADRHRYDNRAGQTAILAEDVHAWVEVNAGNGTWIPIEPTPGYEPPRETLTWSQWATMAMAKFVDWLKNHAVHVLIGAVLALMLFLARRACLDTLAFSVCRLMGLRSAHARLLWTVRLLEWRSRLTGCSRPRQSTVAAWYAPLFQAAPADTRPALTQFLHWADQLLYAPTEIDPASHAEIHVACRSAVSASTPRLFAKNLIQSNKS